jgi:hypothetical protein
MVEVRQRTPAEILRIFSARSFPFAKRPVFACSFVLLTALYGALITVPGTPPNLGSGIDASCMLGLNLAHANHLVAGRDFIFTYGPIGYLVWPSPVSGAPAAAFAYCVGLHLVFVAALFRIAIGVRAKTVSFWMIAALTAGLMLDFFSREHRLETTLIAVALIPLAEHTRWRYAELGVVAFLAAFATMVKLNTGVQGVGIFLFVFAAVVFRDWPLSRTNRNQALSAFFLLPGCVLGLYFLSTGGFSNLWSYLRTGWEILSGYSDAMALAGPMWQATLYFALLGFIFIGLPFVAVYTRSIWAGYLPAALTAYLAFKHAIVRQEPGHATSFGALIAVSLLFLFVCTRASRERRFILLSQVGALVMGYAVTLATYGPWYRNDIVERLSLRAPLSYIDLYAYWPDTWKELTVVNAQLRSRARIRGFNEIVGKSTVSIFGWNIERIAAHNWNWRPIPVLQLFNTYTPVLDRINAVHIEGNSAADFALVDFESVDSRHPFLSEPLSWRALLDRYDMEANSGDAILMRHRKTSRFTQPESLGSQMTGWNQNVPVPDTDGFLLMSPHVTKTLYGRLITLLFRSSTVFLDIQLSSGRAVRWRTIASNMSGGVLIQPFPQSKDEFYALFAAGDFAPPSERVLSIRFHTEEPSQFVSEIPIQWSRLSIKH